MNPTKHDRYGYTTTVIVGSISFALFALNIDALRNAFLLVTNGRVYFDPDKVDRVKVSHLKAKEVSA